MLAGTIGERHLWRCEALDRAARYISAQLESGGYAPQLQTFDVARIPVSNIEAALTGADQPAEIVVIGAHYDSVSGCPAANDNGTGVAAMLELAHRFSLRPQPRTLRFVAFVNEEPPFFRTDHMGSVVYANAAKARGDRVTAMLALETMGYYSDEKGSQHYPEEIAAHYPDVGNFIGFVGNTASAELLQRSRQAFERRTQFPLQTLAAPDDVAGVGWSDHWAFWQAGYPGMMVTDTAPFRYPWYHTADDTPDQVDYDKLSEVVDGLEAVIEALAG
jgi:Zn-dependent M28 family amino/carboxypeptidase